MGHILSAIKKCQDSGYKNVDKQVGNYEVQKRGSDYDFVYLNKKNPRYNEEKLHYAKFHDGKFEMWKDFRGKYDPDWAKLKKDTKEAIKKARI